MASERTSSSPMESEEGINLFVQHLSKKKTKNDDDNTTGNLPRQLGHIAAHITQ